MLNKTIKTFIFLFITFCTLSIFSFSTYAKSDSHVFSDGNYLSSSDIDKLETLSQEIIDQFDVYPVIYLTKSINNSEMNLDDFSENFFLSQKYDTNAKGTMLLVDFDRRKIWITSYSTSMHNIFDNSVNQKIVNSISSDFSNENYYDACFNFLNEVKSKLDNTNSSYDDSYNNNSYYEDSFFTKFKKSAFSPLILIISLVVALIIPTVIAISSKGKNDITSTTYEDDGSFNLSRQDDVYVSTYTTSVRINNDNHSSGGGSSSSGSGNSGAGGSF